MKSILKSQPNTMMRVLVLGLVILEIFHLVQGDPGKPGADWTQEETEIIFKKILRVFTHTGDAIRKYDKDNNWNSKNEYKVQKTKPNHAKASIQHCLLRFDLQQYPKSRL